MLIVLCQVISSPEQCEVFKPVIRLDVVLVVDVHSSRYGAVGFGPYVAMQQSSVLVLVVAVLPKMPLDARVLD
jgi:hypothetical protein